MSPRKFTSARSVVIAMTLVATSLTATVASADDSVATMSATPAGATAGTNSDGVSDAEAKPRHHHHHEEAKAPATDTAKAADPTPAPTAAATPEAPKAAAPIDAKPAAPEAPAATPLALRETHPLAMAPEPPANTTWKLAGILIALCAGAFFLKRRNDQRKPADQVKSLQVLKKLSIGVRSELLVVDIDGQRLLIGVTPNSIQTLAALPDPEAVEMDEPRRATSIPPRAQDALGDRFQALVERSRTSDADDDLDSRSRVTAPPARRLPSKRPAAKEAFEGQARGLADRRENVPRDSRGLAKIGRL
ncbi:MAG: flagellar biosynthetic protein FliO [Polyangiaceae bacterium]